MQKKKSELNSIEKGDFLREFIFGLNDGLVSTLALLAGLSGAVVANWIIIVSGLAEILAGSISMGLGAYISRKSEIEYYKNKIEKERKAIGKIPNIEIKEIKEIYRKKGFNEKEVNFLVNKIIKNKIAWLDVLVHDKLGIVENFDDPKKIGLTNGVAFVIGGLFPLLPFLFFESANPLFIGTIFALILIFAFGAIKSRITGKNWFTSGFEMAFICLLAAGLSYIAGRLIFFFIGG